MDRITRSVTVLIVDDHELVRFGLRALLESQRGLSVIAEAATAAAAIACAARLTPGLVLMEAALPDGSGTDACREIRARVPASRVIMLSDRVDEVSVMAALRAGAAGCLCKRVAAPDLCRAIKAVAGGASHLHPTAMRLLLHGIRGRQSAGARDIVALTPQERRVLALVAQGKTNREIAAVLGLSEKTVKNYLSHAFEKLNVSRRAEAAVVFSREAGAPERNGARARSA